MVFDLQVATGKEKAKVQPKTRASWRPPPLGKTKINVEAYAVRDGVQIALARGLREVVVETDTEKLVNLW